MMDPQLVGQKWGRNLAAATQSIKEGVQNVQQAPTEKAAARQDAYLAGVQRAVAENKFANALRRVSLQDWQKAMVTKGINRIAQGASEAVPKMVAFMSEFLPYLDAGVRSLPPRGDIEQNKQRVLQMIDYNARFRRTRS